MDVSDMLGLKNVPAGIDPENFALTDGAFSLKRAKQRIRPYLRDALIILVMTVLLCYGASWQFSGQFTDLGRYQCYAVAFWQGVPALHALPRLQCLFLVKSISSAPLIQQMEAVGLPGWLISLVASQPTAAPFHVLPPEYPLLTLVPISLGMITPLAWYRVTFALWMALVVVIVYFILKRYKSNGAAIAFAIYLVAGSWSTALARFDIIPAALTLIALLCAERKKWKWAFALLAVATVFKFYPLVLILPLFIAQQMQLRGRWYAWRRWSNVALFAAICIGVTGVSLCSNVEGTLAPFSYFSTRPIQIESLSASLLWLGSFLGFSLHPVSSYGSLNVLSRLSPFVAAFGTVCLGIGLGYTFWLQLRGKIHLFMASLLTLLVVMITGKVFSPQYLIWVFPLVAYIGKNNRKWLVSWGGVGLLTTWIFPFMYTSVHRVTDVPLIPAFYPVIFVRNMLLLGIILALLYRAARPRSTVVMLPFDTIDNEIAQGGTALVSSPSTVPLSR